MYNGRNVQFCAVFKNKVQFQIFRIFTLPRHKSYLCELSKDYLDAIMSGVNVEK